MGTDDKIAQLPGTTSWLDTFDQDCADLQRLIGYFLKIENPEYRGLIIKFSKTLHDFERDTMLDGE
jgi:hypothetical protein